MDPDLMADYARGPAEPDHIPFIDLSIEGEGLDFRLKNQLINADGGTHFRFDKEEEGAAIDRLAVDTAEFNSVLVSCSAHTWNAEGNHVDIFVARDLKEGESFEKDVEVELDGRVLRFKVALRFTIRQK